MRVLIFGATGMVGQGVLRECLLDAGVEAVTCVGRSPVGQRHAKLGEILLPDLFDLAPVEHRLTGFDACFFCLGVSALGLSEAEYQRLTHDLTLSIASVLARRNPSMTFVYVSGLGTDSTESGKSMWARVKGATENGLLRLPFKAAYMFRPGGIIPMDGIRSKTRSYQVFYAVMRPVLMLLHAILPGSVTTTQAVGRAMLAVARNGFSASILDGAAINAASRLAPGDASPSP